MIVSKAEDVSIEAYSAVLANFGENTEPDVIVIDIMVKEEGGEPDPAVSSGLVNSATTMADSS